jgi:peptidoglycan/xylan/chitin deacetylase (PgdA/CDA1 family)
VRILHLLSQNHLTGAEVYAVNLIQNQVKQNHLVWQASNAFFIKSLAVQVKLRVESKTTLDFFKSVLELRTFLKQNRIQVVHCHSRAAAKLCFYARLGLKISDACGGNEKVAQVSTIHGRQHSSISKKLFSQYGEFLIAVCENVKFQLTAEFNYAPNRIKLIRNSVETSQFTKPNPEQKPNESLHRDLRVAGDVRIAVIGRCTGPKKDRTEIFLNAVHDVLLMHKINFDLTVVGDNSANLKTSATYKTIEHAQIDYRFLKQFDLICGSGRVAVEAGLAEVPCLAFGEYSCEGLLAPQNLDVCLQSNFGDIGTDFSGPHYNNSDIHRTIEHWLRTRNLETFKIDLKKVAETLQAEFSDQWVHRRIERIYESAFFLRQYSRWIPILMYHKIPEAELDSPHKIFVTKSNFERHLRVFNLLGFKTITFSELEKFRTGQKSWSLFPRKPLILTFDDGYTDNLVNASPLLRQYGFNAQLFLLAEKELKSNSWDHKDTESGDAIVSGTDRQRWLNSSFEIGSHGIHHIHLPAIPLAEADHEISASKKMLQNEFNHKINTYAFTYGDTNSELAELAFKAGYSYAVNTDSGGLLLEEEPYSIFRVNIFPNESFFSLFKKTANWYRKYYFKKRGK